MISHFIFVGIMQADRPLKIIVADDEQGIVSLVRIQLELSGYKVFTAKNGREVLELMAENPDLIVLDIMMPEMDGIETLKKVRAFSPVAVIIISARNEASDKIKGLNLGADDYLSKPFYPVELMSRIEAVMRRLIPTMEKQESGIINLGNMVVNLDKHEVTINGRDVHLAHTEWLLLKELIINREKLVTYNHLLCTIWGSEYYDEIKVLQTWMSRLRIKIGNGSGIPVIENISGTGYILKDNPIPLEDTDALT